jgi:hypothetical protein
VALASDPYFLVGVDVAAPQQLRRGGAPPGVGAGAGSLAQPPRPLLEALSDLRDQLTDGEVGGIRACDGPPLQARSLLPMARCAPFFVAQHPWRARGASQPRRHPALGPRICAAAPNPRLRRRLRDSPVGARRRVRAGRGRHGGRLPAGLGLQGGVHQGPRRRPRLRPTLPDPQRAGLRSASGAARCAGRGRGRRRRRSLRRRLRWQQPGRERLPGQRDGADCRRRAAGSGLACAAAAAATAALGGSRARAAVGRHRCVGGESAPFWRWR